MDDSTTPPSEPPDAKELLNALDMGVVGSERPRTVIIKEPEDYEEPDNDPAAPDQAWA